jgi:hypothetical protein
MNVASASRKDPSVLVVEALKKIIAQAGKNPLRKKFHPDELPGDENEIGIGGRRGQRVFSRSGDEALLFIRDDQDCTTKLVKFCLVFGMADHLADAKIGIAGEHDP